MGQICINCQLIAHTYTRTPHVDRPYSRKLDCQICFNCQLIAHTRTPHNWPTQARMPAHCDYRETVQRAYSQQSRKWMGHPWPCNSCCQVHVATAQEATNVGCIVPLHITLQTQSAKESSTLLFLFDTCSRRYIHVCTCYGMRC